MRCGTGTLPQKQSGQHSVRLNAPCSGADGARKNMQLAGSKDGDWGYIRRRRRSQIGNSGEENASAAVHLAHILELPLTIVTSPLPWRWLKTDPFPWAVVRILVLAGWAIIFYDSLLVLHANLLDLGHLVRERVVLVTASTLLLAGIASPLVWMVRQKRLSVLYALTAILVLGELLRLVWVLGFPTVPQSDFAINHEIALSLSNGEISQTYARNLGYPAILSLEIARNSVESKRPSELIDYATAAPFAMDFLETALANEDSSSGI